MRRPEINIFMYLQIIYQTSKLYIRLMKLIERESNQNHKFEGKKQHPDGSNDISFMQLNQNATLRAKEKFALVEKKLKSNKAPDFENLNFGVEILNQVSEKKLRLEKERLEEKNPNKFAKNIRNSNKYDKDIGWKYQTKSLKKLVSYHIFIQIPEEGVSQSYIGQCKRISNKIDTPAILVKYIKNRSHLKAALQKSKKSEQAFIYKKFNQAGEIIKEDLGLLKEYRYQFLTYIHFIRLFITFLLKQQEQKWSQSQQRKQQISEQMILKIDKNSHNTGEMEEESFLADAQMEPKKTINIRKIPVNEPIFKDQVNYFDDDIRLSPEALNNIDNYFTTLG